MSAYSAAWCRPRTLSTSGTGCVEHVRARRSHDRTASYAARVTNAQTWTLVGTTAALSTTLVSVIIVFMTSRFSSVDRRFDEMERRFDEVTATLDRVDRRFEQVDHRFERVDERFAEVDRRFSSVDARLDRMQTEIQGLDRDVQALARHITGGGPQAA